MNRKRMIGLGGTILVCGVLAFMGQALSKEKRCRVMDAEGTVIAEIIYRDETIRYECKEGYESYVDLAYREAAAIVGEQEEIEEPQAYRRLADEEMYIRTAFRKDAEECLLKICEGDTDLSFSRQIVEKAAAVSDTEGHILASYSYSLTDPFRNYISYPTYAGSTIKPISVYGPAIEEKAICWSSLYQDSAYNQITGEDGELKDWPVNTHPYSNTMWTAQEALQKSNNSIAVKVLKDYGVEKACKFLQGEFGIGTDEEQKSIVEKGEDSVLSNIALGYLEEGVTMQEMMGAYQTFANGGMYTKMHTVTGIETGGGEVYYQEEAKSGQVFSPETAYIMNRMMKTVVEEGGTGKSAGVEGLDICGKTGTSDDFKDNWFIGMTPEYVCAVWYEDRGGLAGNESAAVFREILKKLEHNREIVYPTPENVAEEFYCTETGLLASEHCEEKRVGYYRSGEIPEKCNVE